MKIHYTDIRIHRNKYIFISLEMYIYRVDRFMDIYQIDRYAFLSANMYVHICEYSLSLASRNFNKMADFYEYHK